MGVIVKEQEARLLTAPYIGQNIVNFLEGITLIETRIGQMTTMEVLGENKSMIVSGHIIEDMDTPTWLYTDSNTLFNKSSKFTSVDETPITQVIKSYCEIAGIDPKGAIDKLKKINDNLLLVVPFKPGRFFEVVSVSSAGGTTNTEMILKALKWETNPETHRLEANLVFKSKKTRNYSTVALPIIEYLSTFRLSGTKEKLSDGTDSRDIMKFDVCGILKPIEFVDKDHSLIIDGTYLYEKIDDKTSIIGIWAQTGTNLITFRKLGAGKLAKKLNASLELISAHKKYIAPYKSFETNVVKV